MKINVKEVVRGATRIAFKNDDGDNIEAGSVFIDVSLDKEGQGFGYRTEAMKCIDLAVVDRIKHMPFPFEAELFMEMRATAKTTKLIVMDVKPLARAAVVPGAKAA